EIEGVHVARATGQAHEDRRFAPGAFLECAGLGEREILGKAKAEAGQGADAEKIAPQDSVASDLVHRSGVGEWVRAFSGSRETPWCSASTTGGRAHRRWVGRRARCLDARSATPPVWVDG